MNPNALAKNYGRLTPEERWRLIVAADARGDDAEENRLANAAERIHFTSPDFSPYGKAFFEVALVVFIELLDEAARCDEFWLRADAHDPLGDDEDEVEDGDEAPDEPGAQAGAVSVKDGARKRPVWQRSGDIAMASGLVLRTKAAGWRLFCERLTIPPFGRWEGLPGFHRVQGALNMAEKLAFTSEEMRRWLNRTRPAGDPEVRALGLTPEGCAMALEEVFRQRVAWWGG
jgi:hypothetical protein